MKNIQRTSQRWKSLNFLVTSGIPTRFSKHCCTEDLTDGAVGTCRKLRPLRIMVDMMVSIMRAWGWDDLCKVMAAIQRLKRRQDHLHSRCALEQPSSFLTLASPWVQVGLSDLADRPHRLQGRWGWLWLWLPAPPHALPPCRQVSCLHGSDAARRHQLLDKYC